MLLGLKNKTLIEIDIANFSLDMVLPLGNIYVYKTYWH